MSIDVTAFLVKHSAVAEELQDFIGQQNQFRRMMMPARESQGRKPVIPL